ncbi:MAG TPA: glycine betaine ABC transporter substrate-binding protein [Gaiellaceae bacterium]|nr:glycine betaine ABC transporter substrate-binding protein [Gaiellaceae bacterium]
MKVRAGGLVAVAAAVVAALLTVVGAAAAGSKACGTVTINEQAWAGSTANTYVVKNVLEKSLGCKVSITKIAEVPVYQAMADGKTDAILEDWGHVDQQKQYVKQQKTVVYAGKNGVTGVIGWYIPTYLMKQYPQFKTWKGLKGKETLFKSPESGSQGMFLGGDPSYQQKDQTLIKALHLNFKFVSVGAEPAQVARWEQLYKQHKPVIFYWYDPQYLNATYQLSMVQLPPRFKGCQDDEKQGGNPAKYACAYPKYVLTKFMSKKFATSGSPAVGVIKRFSWTNADQNVVAGMIAGQHMDPDKAAQKWIAANQAKVNKWLGK